MQAEIFRLWPENFLTALPVTHDVAEALVAKRVIVLPDRLSMTRADRPVERSRPCRRDDRGTPRCLVRSS